MHHPRGFRATWKPCEIRALREMLERGRSVWGALSLHLPELTLCEDDSQHAHDIWVSSAAKLLQRLDLFTYFNDCGHLGFI